MNIKERLVKLGCPDNTHTYLGDGVYAGNDGYYVWLVTMRDYQIHEIALEVPVISELNKYIAKVRNS